MKEVATKPLLDERKARLEEAFNDSRLAARLLHERFAPPATPYDTPPAYTRLQRALGLGMLIRSIPEEDIARFMLGKDDIYHKHPFHAKHVRVDGDTYHATFGDGSEYSYDVTPRNTHHVTHNDVSVTVPDSLDTQLTRVNTPFARDALYSGTTTLALPEAHLVPSLNKTPRQEIRTAERTLEVYVIAGPRPETIVNLPRKHVPRFNADFD